IRARYWFPNRRLILHQVASGDQTAVCFHVLGDQSRSLTFVELPRALLFQPLQSGPKLGLYERLALFVEVAASQEDPVAVCEFGQGLRVPLNAVRGNTVECKSLRGEPQCRLHYIRPLQAAVPLLGECKPGDASRNSDGFVTNGRGAFDDLSGFVQVHLAGGSGRGLFSVIDDLRAAI